MSGFRHCGACLVGVAQTPAIAALVSGSVHPQTNYRHYSGDASDAPEVGVLTTLLTIPRAGARRAHASASPPRTPLFRDSRHTTNDHLAQLSVPLGVANAPDAIYSCECLSNTCMRVQRSIAVPWILCYTLHFVRKEVPLVPRCLVPVRT